MNAPHAWSPEDTARLTVEEDEEEARRERLRDWLIANGAHFAPVSIDICDGERGVRACAQLAPGTVVARIPEKLFITTEAAARSRVGRLVKARSRAVSPKALLAMHLLELRREGGFWEPYVDSLPRAFPGHPIGFGAIELMALDARSAIGGATVSMRATYRDELRSVAEVLSTEGFTPDDFQWAYLCVRTRHYDLSGNETAFAMIPFADMLNHVAQPGTLGRRPDRGDYVITATRPIGAGQEVTATYGKHGNASLLPVFGFVIEDNELDLARLHIGDDSFMISRKYADPAVRDMFRTLRRAEPNDLRQLRSMVGHAPADAAREQRVLATIHAACKAVLAQRMRCDATEDIAADSQVAALRKAIATEENVLWHLAAMTQAAGRVLKDRGANAQDRALLAHMDPDYAATLAPLIDAAGAAS